MIAVIAILSFLICITYLVFPIVTILLAKFVPEKSLAELKSQPNIFLIMAVHNEASVIEDKLNSIIASKVDFNKLYCFIGADACTDNTVDIISRFQNKLNVDLVVFERRNGKPQIINELVKLIHKKHQINEEDLFLLTDANVMFHPNFIKNISHPFSESNVGLVDGMVINPKKKSQTGKSESVYVSIETQIKIAESNLWQCAMGPFGGAYMLRAKLYKNVPSNFLVDDFFIAFQVLKSGAKALVNKNAICYEEVSGSFKEEFRRKVRISSGNFQNTFYFFPHYLNIFKKHNLIFLLHKLLRWLTPIFMLIVLVLLAFMSFSNPIACKILLIMISLLVGIPLTNYLLNQLNLNFKPLHGVSYLIMMNIALLIGFFKFIKGIQSNVWEPTKRKISSS